MGPTSQVQTEVNLGKVAVEDEDVALFGGEEEKVERNWRRQFYWNPSKKLTIPLWRWARWASRRTSESQTMDR